MAIMVCGGAGYIGSHCVYKLIERGEKVVVVDNLETGNEEAIHKEAVFYKGDIRDAEFIDSVFRKEKIDAVIHFAANSLVGESMLKPLKYFNNNVHGTESLLNAMVDNNVKKIVFSSTAAVYGEPETELIKETDPTNPTNTYGETKLMMEKMMRWVDEIHGMRYVSLRYFNVAGAHPNGEIGEAHDPETHLIPLVLRVPLGVRDKIMIFGDDYPTEDGTCIRDYIHVMDLVDAHILALDYLNKGSRSSVFNLGNGKGFSVKEIVDAAERATGQTIARKVTPRRMGDPAVLVASSEKAQRVLKWKPVYTDIEEIIKTAYDFYKTHKDGYKK
nr:UDP-glucose 4-epimerase GalE [Tissierella sp.]